MRVSCRGLSSLSWVLWLAVAAAAGWLVGEPAVRAADGPRADRTVILVSVDGLAGFYLDDPRAELPTLRRLAREGARAEGLVCSFPTVTWPNHTTLVTGCPPSKHGVVGNNFIDRAERKPVALILDPVFDKADIVRAPTIYDAAHAAGLTTCGIVWPSTRRAATLTRSVPDMAADNWARYGTAEWLAELKADGIPVDKHGAWCADSGGGVWRDWMYVRMAAQAIRRHQPNVLLLHLIEVDHTQHRFGPQSDEAYWAVSFADDRLRDLIEAVEASPRRAETTILICSDHGFFPIEKDIRPNVVLKQLGLATETGGKAAAGAALALSQGGGCAVSVFDDARRAELVAALAEELGRLEGVDRVILPAEFDSIGQPTREADPKGADLWLSAKAGYSFTDSAEGDNPVVPRSTRGGTHGYLPGHPELLGTCVLWGAGIQPGTRLGRVSNEDIAPTMARLINVPLPTATGRVLTEALTP